MTIPGRDQVPTGVTSVQFVPIRHFGLVCLPAEINPTAVERGRKVDQPVLGTADRKADTAVEKPLLDEILNRPAAVRKRMLMLRVLLVIRVASLRDQVAPKNVQHGQLVHLPDRHVAKALNLIEGGTHVGKHRVGLLDRKSMMTHDAILADVAAWFQSPRPVARNSGRAKQWIAGCGWVPRGGLIGLQKAREAGVALPAWVGAFLGAQQFLGGGERR